MGSYLRLVHFVVVFRQCGSLLLVSERDADRILRLMKSPMHLSSPVAPLPYDIVDLTYCKLAVTDPAAYRRLGPALPQWLPEVIQNDGFVQLVCSVEGLNTRPRNKEQL